MSAAVLTAGAVTIPPPAADSPDADLIRLCTEYVALRRELNRLMAAEDDARHRSTGDRQVSALVDRLREMAPTIAAMPAVTDDGVRAKAAFVLHHASDDADQDRPSLVSDELAPAHSLALDLLRPRPVLVHTSRMVLIAERLAADHARIEALEKDENAGDWDSGPNKELLQGWWDGAGEALDCSVAAPADVVALARICRTVWARCYGDECDLREELDQKLHEVVIAQAERAAVLAQADRELLALAEEVKAAEMDAYRTGEDDDIDAATDRSCRAQEKMLEIVPVGTDGLRAYARAALWDAARQPGGELRQSGSGSDALLWGLAKAILGGDEAKAFYVEHFPVQQARDVGAAS